MPGPRKDSAAESFGDAPAGFQVQGMYQAELWSFADSAGGGDASRSELSVVAPSIGELGLGSPSITSCAGDEEESMNVEKVEIGVVAVTSNEGGWLLGGSSEAEDTRLLAHGIKDHQEDEPRVKSRMSWPESLGGFARDSGGEISMLEDSTCVITTPSVCSGARLSTRSDGSLVSRNVFQTR
jgi:hypothetical protein